LARRGVRGQRFVIAIVAVSGIVNFSSCGDNRAVLRAGAQAVRFYADTRAPGTALAEGARALDEALANEASIRAALNEINNSTDPLGASLTWAICTGLQQVGASADDAQPPTEQSWESFLVAEVTTLSPRYAGVAKQRVDAFLTTVNLAGIDPRLARAYYEECVRKPG
jgi:hypothetical protein